MTHRQHPSLRLRRGPGRCRARAGRDWAGLGLRIGHKQPWRERDGGGDSCNEDTQSGRCGWRADQYLSACGFRRIRGHARRLERPPLRIHCIAIRPRRCLSRINIVCACIAARDEPSSRRRDRGALHRHGVRWILRPARVEWRVGPSMGCPPTVTKKPPSNEIRTSAAKVNFRCSVRRSRHCVPHQPAARSERRPPADQKLPPESWLLRWGVIYHAQVGGIFRLNRNTLSGSY